MMTLEEKLEEHLSKKITLHPEANMTHGEHVFPKFHCNPSLSNSSFKATNVNLMQDDQIHWNSCYGSHESLYKISWQSM